MSFKNKKLIKSFLKLALVGVVVFFALGFSLEALAQEENNPGTGGIGGYVEKGMGWVLEKSITAVRKVAHLFLSLAMQLLNLTTSNQLYEDVLFSDSSLRAIDIGWRLVRDFVNMFFVLILVFIAVCTILQIPRYSDKKLIAWVIFGALMVNFSKPIALVFIDASNLAMNFFIENIGAQKSDLSSMLLHTSRFGEIFQGNTLSGSVDFIVLSVTEIIFTIILATMIGILAVSLLIRIFAFWILIVLSPLAFFGFVLPSFSGMKSNWFNKMFTYAFYGPLMMFFLWLAIVLLTGLTWDKLNNPGAQIGMIGGSSFGQQSKSFFSSAMGMLVPYAATIYFLYYGFDLSKNMASKAGSAMSGWMQRGTGYLQTAQKGALWAGALGGTAGLAGVGYLGGKKAGRQAKYVGENVSDTLSKKPILKHLTKKGRETAREEEKAIVKKRGVLFGAPGTTDKGKEYNKMVNTKSSEMRTEWKDSGAPSESELRGMLTGSDEMKATAAARWMAEEGMLNINSQTGENYYAQARDVFDKRGDKAGLGRIDELAEKSNLRSVLQYKMDYVNNEAAKKKLNERVSKKLKTLEESGGRIDDQARARATQEAKEEMRGDVIGGKVKSMSVNELIKNPDLFVDEKGESLTKGINQKIQDGEELTEQEKISKEFVEKTKERVASSKVKVDQLRQQVSSNPKVGAAQDIWTQEVSKSADGGSEHQEYLQKASNPGANNQGQQQGQQGPSAQAAQAGRARRRNSRARRRNNRSGGNTGTGQASGGAASSGAGGQQQATGGAGQAGSASGGGAASATSGGAGQSGAQGGSAGSAGGNNP